MDAIIRQMASESVRPRDSHLAGSSPNTKTEVWYEPGTAR